LDNDHDDKTYQSSYTQPDNNLYFAISPI